MFRGNRSDGYHIFEIFVRYRIQISIVRHSLVERSIEYSYLWNFRKKLLYSVDTFQVCRVMQRTEVAAFFYSCYYSIVNKHRTAEFCSSVQYAVAYSVDFVKVLYSTVFCICQCIKYKLNSSSVFRNILFDDFLFSARKSKFKE